MKTFLLQADVANPLPLKSSLAGGSRVEPSSSKMISEAVQDGISSVLESLGLSGSAKPLSLVQEGWVTRYDIVSGWKYPVDPKGKAAKGLPYLEERTRKATGETYYRMIIPRGFFKTRVRPQGSTAAECIANGRKLMLAAFDQQHEVDGMPDKVRRRFLHEEAEIKQESLGDDGIWEALSEGKRILKARKEYNIPAEIDMVNLAIRFSRLAAMGLAEIIESYFQYLDTLSHNTPTRTGNDNHQNDRAIIRRLALRFKDKGPLFLLMADITPIVDFFREEIHEAEGTNATKAKNYRALDRFFKWLVSRYHFTPIDKTVMGNIPKVGLPEFKEVPGPEDNERFLNLVLLKYPTYLPMAVMVVWVARPEESWNTLEDLWAHWRETFIRITDPKANTVDARNVRVRPCALAWFRMDPRFISKAKDLRPLGKDGRPLSYQQVEKKLREIMKEVGWMSNGRNDKEYHRKGFISAQIAVGNEERLIIAEAGHNDDGMLVRYNKHWAPSKGMKYFDVWPPGMTRIPTRNLHQPHGAKLTKRSSYVIRPPA